MELAEEALKLAVACQNQLLEAQARCALGSTLSGGGIDTETAVAEIKQALKLAESLGDAWLKAYVLNLLARTVGVMDITTAQQAATEALALYRAQNNTYGELQCLFTFTQLARGQGQFEQMLSYATRGLYLAIARGDRDQEATMKGVTAGIYSDHGDYGLAIHYYQEALAFYEEVQHEGMQIIVQLNLALVYCRVGDWSAAKRFTEAAMVTTRKSGDQITLFILLINYTLTLLRQGNVAAAADAAREAIEIGQSGNLQEYCGYAFTNLGHVLLAQKQYAAAASAYEKALTIRRELGQTFLLMETQAGLAQLMLVQAKLDQAVELVEAILPQLTPESVTGTEEPMQIYLVCYQVLLAVGDGRATAVLTEANQLIRERAAKLKEPELKRMFLENIPAHKTLLAAYQHHEP